MKKIYCVFIVYTSLLFSGKITGQCTTPSVVPYYESFSAITASNQLPTCWAASNMSVTCLTFTSGGSGVPYAGFYHNPPGAKYFYTNGIQLSAGVIYSVCLWYQTDPSGSINWSDLSILLNTGQNATGASTLVSTNGPALSAVSKTLSSVFSVTATGVYYLAVRGTSSFGNSPYLLWDDLSVTIPCTGAGSGNTPTVSIVPSSTGICTPSPSAPNLTLWANGTADTYTWSTGQNTPVISPVPVTSTTFYITGTNTLTGCTQIASTFITVYPNPSIFIIASSPAVCPGGNTNLNAIAASNLSYSWNTGATSQNTTVNPTITTGYTVVATNSFACASEATVVITVYPSPVITLTANRSEICSGEKEVITAGGGVNYLWINSGVTGPFPTQTVTPVLATTIYSVTGTDQNSCQKTVTLALTTKACAGIPFINTDDPIRLFPNPNNGWFMIETDNSGSNEISISDLSGREVYSAKYEGKIAELNVRHLANGFYFVKIESENGTEIVRMIKQ